MWVFFEIRKSTPVSTAIARGQGIAPRASKPTTPRQTPELALFFVIESRR